MSARLDIYQDAAGKFRWRAWSGSDITADSGQGYVSKSNARRAWRRFEAAVRAGIEVRP